MGKIFGGASSGSGAVCGGGGAAAGIGGAVASGAAGWVGAIASVGTLASSIVGNFQFAGMNKSLDIIVKHSLQIANDLANLRRDAWDREGHLMLKLDDVWGEIRNVVLAVTIGGGGGRGGLTFNNCNFTGSPDQIANSIFSQASLAGAL